MGRGKWMNESMHCVKGYIAWEFIKCFYEIYIDVYEVFLMKLILMFMKCFLKDLYDLWMPVKVSLLRYYE
jgi:hypothetical protein